jgi:cell filamentation protein
VTQDPYLRPSGVLHNEHDIDDAATLARLEANAALRGALLLFRRPGAVPATWDLDHVRGIHRLLFGPIYPWAGELRTVDVVKGTTRFANAEYLQDAATDMFRRLLDPSARLRGMDRTAMVARASVLLAELNLLHPFREGNGRTQRAFLQLLFLETGSVLRWDRITADQKVWGSSPYGRAGKTRSSGTGPGPHLAPFPSWQSVGNPPAVLARRSERCEVTCSSEVPTPGA